MPALDAILGGGFGYGRIHEVYTDDAEDAVAAAGFAAAVAVGMAEGSADKRRSVLWLRNIRVPGRLQANGWAELGGAPEHGLLGTAPDCKALLRAAIDALRCADLGAVIVESWRRMPELDLTASRRLALAAKKSGVPLFLLRIDATPLPSAAQTRWQVSSAPSRALPGNAPGQPSFDIALLRQRSGQSGLNWRVEWDRDRRKFREASSGAVVSVSSRRPAADPGSLPLPDIRNAA